MNLICYQSVYYLYNFLCTHLLFLFVKSWTIPSITRQVKGLQRCKYVQITSVKTFADYKFSIVLTPDNRYYSQSYETVQNLSGNIRVIILG